MNKKKIRQKKLFNLLTSEFHYQPSNYFSESLSVSTKTIYNDIDYLNKEMKAFDLTINKKPRYGFLLIGSDKNKKSFQQYLSKEIDSSKSIYDTEYRQMDMICCLLRKKEGCSLEEFEKRYYISDSTVRLDIEQLKERFAKDSFEVCRTKGKLVFKGSESAIQKAVKNYLIEALSGPEFTLEEENFLADFFQKKEIIFARDIVHFILAKRNNQLSDYYRMSLFFFFLVLNIRLKEGIHYDISLLKKENISILENYFFAYEIAEFYKKNTDFKLNEQDILVIAEQLYANNIHGIHDIEKMDAKIEKSVDTMINNLGNLLSVDISDDFELRKSLMAHIPPMIFRLRSNIKIESPLLSEIKQQYLLLFSLLWYILSDLESEYQIKLNDDEISFLVIYFQISLEKRHGIYFKKILIICPTGLSTSKLLYTKVRAMLPMRDRIITKTMDELSNTDLEEVDFIISSVAISIKEVPIVFVSPLLTDIDKIKIMDEYAKQDNKYRSLTKASKSTIYQTMDAFLDENFLFCKKNFATKEECLEFLIQLYEEKQFVSSEFRQSVYDREAMGDTSIYTGVAIPHVSPETIYQTKISIVTLKRAIKWGANDVTMVIFLAIANEDLGLAREIIKKIFSIAENQKKISLLNKASTSVQLMAVFRNDLYEIK